VHPVFEQAGDQGGYFRRRYFRAADDHAGVVMALNIIKQLMHQDAIQVWFISGWAYISGMEIVHFGLNTNNYQQLRKYLIDREFQRSLKPRH